MHLRKKKNLELLPAKILKLRAMQQELFKIRFF